MPSSKKRTTAKGLTYAVNPSDDCGCRHAKRSASRGDDRLTRRRVNPAELVVIENPAPPKRSAKRKGKRGAADTRRKTRPRAGAPKPARRANGRFVSRSTQTPAIMAQKTIGPRKNAGARTRRKNSTRRRNPARGMFRNASTIVKDGAGIVLGVGLGEMGTQLITDRVLATQAPTVKGLAAVLVPALAGVAVVNKTKKGSFTQHMGYGLVATAANNALTMVKGVASGAVGRRTAVGFPRSHRRLRQAFEGEVPVFEPRPDMVPVF